MEEKQPAEEENSGSFVERQPVAIWPTIGLLVGAVCREFIPDLGEDLVNALVQFVVVVGPVLIGLWYAQKKVTPVAAPRTEDGKPAKIVPV